MPKQFQKANTFYTIWSEKVKKGPPNECAETMAEALKDFKHVLINREKTQTNLEHNNIVSRRNKPTTKIKILKTKKLKTIFLLDSMPKLIKNQKKNYAEKWWHFCGQI